MNQKFKKIIKNISIIVLAIVLRLLILVGFSVLLVSVLFNDEYDITTDISQYKEVITGEKWGMSEEIFPESLDQLNVLDFKHVYYDPWDANYLAYLVVDYDQESYDKEIERLGKIGINEYKGYYGVTGFSNYELLAMNADSYNGFVYAISDGNNQIIYVELIFCNYYMDIDYENQIPNEYLPDGFNAQLDNPYQLSNTQEEEIEENPISPWLEEIIEDYYEKEMNKKWERPLNLL